MPILTFAIASGLGALGVGAIGGGAVVATSGLLAGVTAGTLSMIQTFVTVPLITLGAQLVASMFNKRKTDPTSFTIKQALPARWIDIGRVKSGGAFAYYAAPASSLMVVRFWCCNRIEEYEKVWVDNFEHTTRLGNGQSANPPGPWGQNCRIQMFDGVPGGVGLPIAYGPQYGLSEWTVADHACPGLAATGLFCFQGDSKKFNQTYPNGAPNVKALYKSAWLPNPNNVAHDLSDESTWDYSDNAARAILRYAVDLDGWYLDPADLSIPHFQQAEIDAAELVETLPVDSEYALEANSVDLLIVAGIATVYQDIVVTANTDYTFSVWIRLNTDGGLTASDIMFTVLDRSNLTTISNYVLADAEINEWTYTRASITFHTPVGCTLIRVYPYRNAASRSSSFHIAKAQLNTGLLPATYEETTATAGTTNKLRYSNAFNNAVWVKSNITVTVDHTFFPAFEPRYSFWGRWTTLEERATVLKDMLLNCCGTLIEQPSGKLALFMGKHIEPTFTLTDDMILEFNMERNPDALSRIDGVKTRITWEGAKFEEQEVPTVYRADFDQMTARSVMLEDVPLKWTGSPYQAQRIARVILNRMRVDWSGTIKAKLPAIECLGEWVIRIQSTRMGGLDAIFLLDKQPALNPTDLTVTLNVKSYHAETYKYRVEDLKLMKKPASSTTPSYAVNDIVIDTVSVNDATLVVTITWDTTADEIAYDTVGQFRKYEAGAGPEDNWIDIREADIVIDAGTGSETGEGTGGSGTATINLNPATTFYQRSGAGYYDFRFWRKSLRGFESATKATAANITVGNAIPPGGILSGVTTSAFIGFADNKYYLDDTSHPDTDLITRNGGTKWVTDNAGVLTQIASNTLAYNYVGSNRRVLFEGASTNSLRNNTMVGAVAGSPGTPPTNWSASGTVSGITRQIVATGINNGIEYIDVRYTGTATATAALSIWLEANNYIATVQNDPWTFSMYTKLLSGSLPTSVQMIIAAYDSSSAILESQYFNIVPTSTMTRNVVTAVLNPATSAFTRPIIGFNFTNGVTYDFTIRIGCPQFEKNSIVTSVIKTSGSTVTRTADYGLFNSAVVTRMNAGGHTLVFRGKILKDVTSQLILQGDSTSIIGTKTSNAKQFTFNAPGGLVINDITDRLPADVGVCMAWGPSGTKVSVNGSAILSNTTSATGSLTNMWIGHGSGMQAGARLEIATIQIWPIVGTDTEIQSYATAYV